MPNNNNERLGSGKNLIGLDSLNQSCYPFALNDDGELVDPDNPLNCAEEMHEYNSVLGMHIVGPEDAIFDDESDSKTFERALKNAQELVNVRADTSGVDDSSLICNINGELDEHTLEECVIEKAAIEKRIKQALIIRAKAESAGAYSACA